MNTGSLFSMTRAHPSSPEKKNKKTPGVSPPSVPISLTHTHTHTLQIRPLNHVMPPIFSIIRCATFFFVSCFLVVSPPPPPPPPLRGRAPLVHQLSLARSDKSCSIFSGRERREQRRLFEFQNTLAATRQPAATVRERRTYCTQITEK